MGNQSNSAGSEAPSTSGTLVYDSTSTEALGGVSSDFVGAFASLLCALHCIATPLLFAAAPMLLQNEESSTESGSGVWSTLWSSLDLVFLALSAWAVWIALRSVTSRGLKAVFIAAFVLFSVGLLGERFGFEHTGMLTYSGAAILIVAHSFRLRKQFGKKGSTSKAYN